MRLHLDFFPYVPAKAVLAVLVMMLLSGLPKAGAQGSEMALTGSEFLEACTRPDPDWISFCHGYVQAVFDGADGSSEAVCVPAGFTRAEIVGAVVDRLIAAPELQEFNAALVARAILAKTYPCQ